jgi:FAD:protein FMN transferase
MHSVKLSLGAMATRFELLLGGDDPARLRAAGEEALAEIERLAAQLSFYRADSEISWLNAHAARQAVKVEPRLFRLLRRAAELTRLTDGAFDVAVGPLMRAWRFVGGRGGVPSREELEAARAVSGIEQVELDEGSFTVRFKRPGVELDLGGYGKGYAVDRAADILREAGVASALLHGGTSSVYAVGAPEGGGAWRVALQEPLQEGGRPVVVGLSDSALSVSAGYGKEFAAGGRRYGHVIDPRTGEPVNGALAAAAVGPSAAECEALSKALLIGGAAWLTTMKERFPGCAGWVASGSPPDAGVKESSKISAV